MADRKKILVFIDWFLPGYKAGGPIRSMANMIDHLEEEYDFFVVTRNTDYTDTSPYDSVKSNQWNQIRKHVSVFYFSESEPDKENIKKLITEKNYDYVYINGIYSRWFSILPLQIAKSKKKKVIVAVRGMLAESAINVKPVKKKLFLLYAKLSKLYSGVKLHATNLQEETDIKRSLGANADVFIADNFPRKENETSGFSLTKNKNEIKLISIARISPEKNTLFALECLQYVKNVSVEFDLYGPVYDENYWKECESQIRKLPENISVHYKGSIESDKIKEVLSAHHALFMPTRGENFGHVIIESLSAGNPVIISDKTPWKDVEHSNAGFALPLGDAKVFAEKIEKMASLNEQEFVAFRKSALNYSVAKNNTPQLLERYRQLFS